MLCSSTSHEHSPILARYQGGPLPGAGYLIHPTYAEGLQHDYPSFALPDAGPAHGQAAVLNYVQDHCSIHSSAPSANPAGLAFPPNLPAPDSGKKFWEPAGLTSSGSSNRAVNNAPDSVLTGQQKSTQQTQRHNGRAFYRSGSSTTATGAKKRKRVATVAQRRAANIRERRRMFNLNEAFDKLRRKVPTFAYEKRLSRIETLRLAITYISFMDQVIRSEASQPASTKSGATIGAPTSLGEATNVTSLPDADHRRQQIDAHFREASSAAPICW